MLAMTSRRCSRCPSPSQAHAAPPSSSQAHAAPAPPLRTPHQHRQGHLRPPGGGWVRGGQADRSDHPTPRLPLPTPQGCQRQRPGTPAPLARLPARLPAPARSSSGRARCGYGTHWACVLVVGYLVAHAALSLPVAQSACTCSAACSAPPPGPPRVRCLPENDRPACLLCRPHSHAFLGGSRGRWPTHSSQRPQHPFLQSWPLLVRTLY